VEEIRKALESGSWESAERLAHTLKGVAGNIGATRLPQLAQALETTIRERHPRIEIDLQLGDLALPLQHLLAQLERDLPPIPIKTPVTVSLEKLAGICVTLERLLIEDNAEAVDLLDANADLLSTAFPAHYRQIEAGIRSCRFEDSLAALRLATKAATVSSLTQAG
jgi:two-component system sensor histidine kinase/response regulator